ncbi:hypothetical protein D3C73_1545870 [compost metagenome]
MPKERKKERHYCNREEISHRHLHDVVTSEVWNTSDRLERNSLSIMESRSLTFEIVVTKSLV